MLYLLILSGMCLNDDYFRSGGVGAYEVKGERNGVFMSALKKYLDREVPIVNVLTKTFRGKYCYWKNTLLVL